jgi:hypothetical protein
MSEISGHSQLKHELSELGINSRGWHLYVSYGYALFLPLGQQWCDLEGGDVRGNNEVAWLKILQACEMDVLPPPELVASIRNWRIPGDLLDAVPPMFVRAAWKASVAAQYSEEGIEEFVVNTLVPLAQWFFVSGSYRHIQPGQMKAGWANLMRLRRDSALDEAKKHGADDWPPIVRRYESGPFDMIALSYAAQLNEEGSAMQHCVGSYADRCRFEPLRIFSIRTKKTKQRIATLSLVENKPGVWDFDQLKGPKNDPVDSRVWQEADGLRMVMNRVSVSDLKTRQFLDFIHSLGNAVDA